MADEANVEASGSEEVKEEKSTEQLFLEGMKGLQGDHSEGTFDPDATEKEGEAEPTTEAESEDPDQAKDEKEEAKPDPEKAGILKALREMRKENRELKELVKESTQKKDPMADISDDQIDSALVKWNRALAKADRDGDEELAEKAEKAVIELGKVQKERLKAALNPPKKEEGKVSEEQQEYMDELAEVRTNALASLPALADKDSELFKASDKTYKKYKVFQQMGPVGEIVAAAFAIASNPALVGGEVTQKVVDNLKQASEKTIRKGSGAGAASGGKKKMSQKELAELADRIKMGRGSFAEAS